jgi:hypothetical protein
VLCSSRTGTRASGWFMFSSARGGELDRNSARHCPARTACFGYSPRGFAMPRLHSKANKNHVLAIIRRIKIFVLNEPLAPQAMLR